MPDRPVATAQLLFDQVQHLAGRVGGQGPLYQETGRGSEIGQIVSQSCAQAGAGEALGPDPVAQQIPVRPQERAIAVEAAFLAVLDRDEVAIAAQTFRQPLADCR